MSLSQAEDEHFLFTSEVSKPVSGGEGEIIKREFISSPEAFK